MPRLLCCLALAACVTSRTAADHPRTRLYNALMIVGGAAAIPAGYEVARAMQDTDGLGPFIGALFGGGGMLGGTLLVICGAAGLAVDAFDLTPTHGS